MKKLRSILLTLFIILLAVLLPCSTAFAIDNPDDIAFGTGSVELYNVYEDVLETGDMLFAAEGYVSYNTTPTDYTASEAFLFQILNTAGTAVITSTPLKSYGDRPIGIYLTASMVTTIGLVSETAYGLRITPNPLLLATEFGGGGVIEGTNQITTYLAPADYVDQNLGVDSDPPNDNVLRNGMIAMARNIEANDTPTYSYLVDVQGYTYLTTYGGDIFIAGIPSLNNMCPILFQTSVSSMSAEQPESTGTYQSAISIEQNWGTTTANALTNIGVYLGINKELAGSLVLFAFAIGLGIFVYKYTRSGMAVLLVIAIAPFAGAYLGLMPLGLAFGIVIIFVIPVGYFFFSRGAL